MTTAAHTRGATPAGRTMAVALAVAASACWGLGLVVAKAGLDRGVSPYAFAVAQLGASVTVLAAAAVGRGVRRATTLGAAGSGVIEYAVGATLVVVGIGLTSAGNAAIINAAEPVLMVLAAMLLIGERVRWTFVLPMAAMVAGLLATTAPDLASAGAAKAGDMLILASAVAGAIYAVVSRRLVADLPPLPLAVVQQASGLAALVAGVALAASAGWIDLGLQSLAADRTALFLVALSGLLGHAAAVWLHLEALKRMPASVFAIYLGLVPAFALVGAHWLLGDPVSPMQLAGGGLVVLAASLSIRSTPRR